MKKTQIVLCACVTAWMLMLTIPVQAQMIMDHGQMSMSAKPALTAGEVRKIDKDTGKITIRHAEIKHLDMPPMTMVFVARDKALLDAVQPGQKVRFMVVLENGQMVVTDIQPAK